MKLSFAVLLLTGVFSTTAALAAPPICLQLRDIQSAKSDDGKIMKFTMRDGRVLYNHLQGVCPDLKFNGFEWTVRGPSEVCEGQQSLRVLQSGQICVLGKFGPPPKAAPAASP
ncbi:MAG: hypothetical protein BGN85_04275 [Alphaproteobacteria bacterium 64-11]|nr:hypothetical protein [Alphaproteobacteria bacterium]OJU09753.1 MAG: hypothetical protein BGN85_04275 [Alphaproteobacteria bacterium 64-11]